MGLFLMTNIQQYKVVFLLYSDKFISHMLLDVTISVTLVPILTDKRLILAIL